MDTFDLFQRLSVALGIAITGLAGGLASSTAVGIMLARLAREHPEQRALLISGTLFADTMMAARPRDRWAQHRRSADLLERR